MVELPIPQAEPDARLQTVGVDADGSEASVVVDGDAVVVGDVRLELDDGLAATLAWTDPRRPELRLELRRVVGRQERREVSLCAAVEEMPGWSGVELIRQQRGRAVEVDGPSMRTVLARVRATLDSGRRSAWQPRGDVEVSLPVPPLPWVGLDAAALADTPFEVVPAGPKAVSLLIPGGPDPSMHRPFGCLGVVAGFVGFGAFALLSASTYDVTGAIFQAIGIGVVAFAALAFIFWRRAPDAPVGTDTLRIAHDHVAFPGGVRVDRRDIARIDALTDPEILLVFTLDDEEIRARPGLDPAEVVALIEVAWDTRLPRA